MYQRILVPVDGSPTSDKGLAEAIALAKMTGGRIRLIHVVDELSIAMSSDSFAGYSAALIPLLREGGEKILELAKKRVIAAGVEVDTALHEVLATRVSHLIIEEAAAWRADLIVIGTHGRRGVSRVLLGSDAEQVLRSASVPVLLVRGA